MKKIYTRQFFIAMLALLCSVTATAHDFEVDGIYYNVTDEANLTVEVTFKGFYANSYSYEYTEVVVIPTSVSYNGKNYSVTSIGKSAFAFCDKLTSITIPNSVTSIGYGAFNYCTGLTSITIPNSVTSIGESAFMDCSGLTSVTIPNSVTSIGDGAFGYCTGLTSIVVEEGNKKYDSRNNCNAIIETETNILIQGCNTTVIPENVTSIGERAFYGCKGLTSVTIGNSVTSIGEGAFSGCEGLTSVTIPNSVTSIGDDAFRGCKGLTSVTIGNSVTSIGDGAFYNCNGLTSIVVEEGNKKYDSRNNCNAIIETETNTLIQGCNTTVIPEDVTSIGDYAFYYCTGLTSVTIPNSVTSIGEDVFYGCKGLTSVTIGNSVTSIGEDAFNGCKGLTSVTIGNSVTSIGEDAFNGCEALTSVTIGNSVTSIGEDAFNGCEALTSVTIPNSVTSIGYNAFRGCEGLTSIYMLSGTPAVVTTSTFSSSYINTTLYVPYGSLEAYKAAYIWWWLFENIVEFDATGIEDVTEDAPAFEITADGIQLTAAEGKVVAVYTAGGALVEKIDSYAGEEITLDKGVYIIRVGGRAVKARF